MLPSFVEYVPSQESQPVFIYCSNLIKLHLYKCSHIKYKKSKTFSHSLRYILTEKISIEIFQVFHCACAKLFSAVFHELFLQC